MALLKFGTILFPKLFEVTNDGMEDHGCRFTDNHVGRYFNWLIDYVGDSSSRMNCTIKEFTTVGNLDKSTGNYSGIIGGVQSGDIDVSVMPFYYPLEGDQEAFDYTPPVYEDTMTMISTYYTTDEKISKDLLFMFEPIPISLWLGLFAAFLVFVRLLDLGNKVLGKRNQPSSWWIVFRAYLDDDNFMWNSPFYVIYAFFASTTIFFAMGFLMNSASTDLVVIEKPATFTSYDQILALKDVQIGLCIQQPEYTKFSQAKPGSYHSRLYKKVFHYYNAEDLVKLGPAFTERKIVIIARELNVKIGGLFYIGYFEKTWPNVRVLLSVDPQHAMKYTNVFTWSKRSPKHIRDKMADLMFKYLEHGLMMFGFTQASEHIAESMLQFVSLPLLPSVERKVSHTVEEADLSGFNVVQLHSIKYFLTAMMICVMLSVLVLIIEHEAHVHFKHLKKFKACIPHLRMPKLSLPKLSLPKLPSRFKMRRNKVAPALTSGTGFTVTKFTTVGDSQTK